MEVALYTRVSTPRQHQHQTIEQQLSRLREYVATLNWIGRSATRISFAITATAVPLSIASVSIASEIGWPWPQLNVSSSRPRIA